MAVKIARLHVSVCVWLVNKVHFLLAGDHPQMGAGSDPHRGSYFSLFCPCNPP